MDSHSAPPRVTSMGGSSPADMSAVVVSHGGNLGKGKWGASSSLFSHLGNTTCSLSCSSFHVWSWCRWLQVLTLHMPAVIAPRCPASDKGMWQAVLLRQMKA